MKRRNGLIRSWLFAPAAVSVLVILGLPLTNGVFEASAEPHINVGLFGLYQPQSMRIQPPAHAPFVLEVDTRREVLYPPPETVVEIRRHDDQLQFGLTLANGSARRFHFAKQISLRPAGASEISAWWVTIEQGRRRRRLCGSLRFRIVGGAIQTVLETNRESLVARTVASEMSGITEMEALKALAVVARTFIHASQSRHRSEGFDFCDTTHCLWYQGEDRLDYQDPFTELVMKAAKQTEDRILSVQGAVRPAYFTGSCGGSTTSPEVVWGDRTQGNSLPDCGVLCQWCQGSQFYRWQRRIRKTVFLAVLHELIGFTPSQKARIIPELDGNGFVLALQIQDSQYRRHLIAQALRSRVGRRLGWNLILSNAYTVKDEGRWLVFRGRGFGHNVGLCLSGAVAQARAGRHVEEILRYYFPAAALTKLIPPAPHQQTSLESLREN